MQQNKKITLPAWVVSLVTRDGYMERFYHHLYEGYNTRQSYEKVEGELKEYYKTQRYSSYESFLVSKTRWIEKKLGK